MSMLLLFRPFGGVGPPPAPPPAVIVAAGRTKPRHRFSVTLKGRIYVFEDLDELIYFVSRQEVEAEQKAEEKGERDAKRILRLGPAKVKPVPPQLAMASAVPEIREYIEAVDKRLDRAYWIALGNALGREAEELEDIKYIAGLDL